jgi:hypothetical protein
MTSAEHDIVPEDPVPDFVGLFDAAAERRNSAVHDDVFDYSKPPRTLTSTRRINGRLCIAGEGPEQADLMLVATCPEDEEAEAARLAEEKRKRKAAKAAAKAAAADDDE